MAVPFWQPGFLYQPGDIVQQNYSGVITTDQPDNPGFELGDQDWTKGSGWTIENIAGLEGTWRGNFVGSFSGLMSLDNFNDPVAVSADGLTWSLGVFPAGSGTGARPTTYSPTFKAFFNVGNQPGPNINVNSSSDGSAWVTNVAALPGYTIGDMHIFEWVETFSLFVLVSADGQIWSSPDGLTFTLRSTQLPGTYDKSAFSPSLGRFLMSSNSSRMFYTDDGLTYTAVVSAIGVSGLAWSETEGIFCAVSPSNQSATSADGITWASGGSPGLTGAFNPLARSDNAGLFVVMRSGSGATTNYASTSPDGITWTPIVGLGTGIWGRGFIYSANLDLFVAVRLESPTDQVGVSTDGINWAFQNIPGLGAPGDSLVDGVSADLGITPMANDNHVPVSAGETSITARGYFQTGNTARGRIGIAWYDISDVLIGYTWSDEVVSGASSVYAVSSLTATAVSGANFAAIAFGGDGVGEVLVDKAEWDYAFTATPAGLIFKAVQASAGFSDGTEPAWPLTLGLTVVDNEVTWEAIAANRIRWCATAIMKSGATEPVFPTEPGGSVIDNTIVWRTVTRRIEDVNCPNTKEVAIVASKVFAADDDIVAFSATVDPLDWTTVDDAGFIPFGLNTYGSQPVTALGLYRSNLVIFNNKAFQMWQVDEDPANFAILDAVPVGCPFFQSLQPVSNDLVFLTEAGIRNMGIAGASTNLQAGFFGKQIDPLVLAAIAAGEVPNSLFYPGQGQYWLFFGPEAFVLTMNGGKKDMSWSRYVFPSDIDDWTILNNDLILRSGEKIWRVDPDELLDDAGGANVIFSGEIWWPYLDFGALGQTKQLIGFDTVADGEYSVVFGYNQNNALQVTTPYTITNGDTLVGDIIPMPLAAPSFQMRLTFTGNTAWEWSASAIYVQDWRRTS